METQAHHSEDFPYGLIGEIKGKIIAAASSWMSADARSEYEQESLGLAEAIWAEYADRELASAAYISIWPVNLHEEACRAQNNEFEQEAVQKLLGDFESLRRLYIPDSYLSQETMRVRLDVDESYARFVLGQIEDTRSLVVYVFQSIASRDRTGDIREWTKKFRSRPSLLPPSVMIKIDRSESEAFRYKVKPIAKLLGLHELCNTAGNIADLLSQPEVFQNKIAAVIQTANALDAADQTDLVAIAIRRTMEVIRNTIPSQLEIPSDSLQWHWHNVSSISRKSWPTDHGEAPSRMPGKHNPLSLGSVGFMSLNADSSETAYKIICAIHKHFNYQQASLVDYTNQPRRSGYSALHTGLAWLCAITNGAPPQTEQSDKIIAEISATELGISFSLRVAVSYGSVFDRRVCLSQLKDRQRNLTVYTPKGHKHKFVDGSTVLDFALRISNKIVPYICAAEINGYRTSNLLQTLSQGDIINLIKSSYLQLPPHGLSEAKQSKQLRKNFLDAFSEEFRRDGWEVLKGYISTEPIHPIIITKSVEGKLRNFLPEACKQSAARFFNKNEARKNENWWLLQMGLFNAGADRLARFGIQPRILDWQVAWLTRKTLSLLATTETSGVFGALSPTNLLTAMGCSTPRHRHDADFTMRPVPQRTNSNMLPEHFIVVEARDYDGLLGDVLREFSRLGIPITQVHADRLTDQQAIVRVRTNMMSQRDLDDLKQGLKNYHNVIQTELLNTEQPHPLERFLPPRRPRLNLATECIESPYVPGPPARATHQFYGRVIELRQLIMQFEMVEAYQGRAVAIHGPLKMGKTSLAHRFLDEEACQRQDVLTLYFCLSDETTWREASLRMLDAISRKYSNYDNFVRFKSTLVESGIDGWKAFLSHLRDNEFKLVLVLDEVYPWLLKRSDSPTTEEDFLAFWRTILGGPVLFALVGPSAALKRLSPAVTCELRQATQVQLERLTLGEAADCLRAKKSVQPIPFDVGKKVVKDAWENLNGNPFWLNHLGKLMWQMAKTQDSKYAGKITYDQEILNVGLKQLADKWELFSDRFAIHIKEYKGIGKLLARLLIENSDKNGEKNTVTVTRDQIHDAVMKYYPVSQAINSKEIEKFINCVIDCGGLEQRIANPNELTVAAPILIEALHSNPFQFA